MDVAEMAVPGKARTSGTNGDKAKGSALATLCIKYATKRMEQEEKEQGKLATIVKSIQELARDGHAEFRSQLTAELNLLKELRKASGTTKAQTMGYSFTSFEVLVSNWKTISVAVEMGYDTTNKPWSLCVAESVQMKQAHAASSHEGPQGPTKRTAGRKAIATIDKVKKLVESMDENEFVELAAWVSLRVNAA